MTQPAPATKHDRVEEAQAGAANMIPVPPLDGGNVLLGVLPPGPTRIVEQLRPYGFLILYALMLTGMLNTMLGPIVGYLRYVLGI